MSVNTMCVPFLSKVSTVKSRFCVCEILTVIKYIVYHLRLISLYHLFYLNPFNLFFVFCNIIYILHPFPASLSINAATLSSCCCFMFMFYASCIFLLHIFPKYLLFFVKNCLKKSKNILYA